MKAPCSVVVLLCGIACLAGAQVRDAKVVAHYLPWFTIDATADYNQDRRGWCGVGADVSVAQCANASQRQYIGEGPLIGEYSQRESHVLQYHLLLAQASGIDAFIVNVNPTSSLQVEIAAGLIAAAAALQDEHGSDKFGVKLAISYDNAQATTQELIDSDFQVLASLLAADSSRSVALKDGVSGGLVLLLWSENAPSQVYDAAKATFGTDCTVLARNPRAYSSSEGNFAWVNPASVQDAESTLETNWGEQSLKDFEWGMANTQQATVPPSMNTLSMGAVYPGFDDSKVPESWNGGITRQISREVTAGSSYDLTWEHALSYMPQRYGGPVAVNMPWVQIVTWNDFPEGTAVEPTAGGSAGLAAYNATFHFTRRWHGDLAVAEGASTQAVNAAVGILSANRIASACVSNCFDLVFQNKIQVFRAVSQFLDGHFIAALSVLDGHFDDPVIPSTEAPSAAAPASDATQTCADVWDTLAGDYSCGSRIEWVLGNLDLTEAEAKAKVGSEFPNECGACASITAAPASDATQTCADVWDTLAGDYSCGSRIEWVWGHLVSTEAEAKAHVGLEFPNECGACASTTAAPASHMPRSSTTTNSAHRTFPIGAVQVVVLVATAGMLSYHF